MKGDQSKWSKLTLGEDKEVKTSSKAKLYVKGFTFTDLDTIECVVGFRIDSHIHWCNGLLCPAITDGWGLRHYVGCLLASVVRVADIYKPRKGDGRRQQTL